MTHTHRILGWACLALLSACGTMPPPAPVATTVTPSGQVQQAQLILQQQGTYHGAIDGIAGPSTIAAIRLYQQAHTLAPTGTLDPPTQASLNIGAAPAGETPAAETPATQMSDGSGMSAADARKLIESQGYTGVTGLYQDDSAVWRGTATRAGKTGEVAIDAKGHVVTN